MEEHFDWEYYVNTNQDLLEAGIDNHQIAWQHWINHGRNEGRNCLEIPEYFNWKYYIQEYSDLEKAEIRHEIIAYEHYVMHGKNEGRFCNESQKSNALVGQKILENLADESDIEQTLKEVEVEVINNVIETEPDKIEEKNVENMLADKLVSIILPVKNGEKYIKNCIESILTQTYKNFELLIINDGSTDNTEEYCEVYKKDPRVMLYSHENIGLPQTLNKGLSLCKGEYVTWISHDNIFYKEAIETMKDALDKFEDTDYVYASYKVHGIDNGLRTAGRLLLKDMLVNFEGSACFLWRKNDHVYDSTLTGVEDYAYLLNLIYKSSGNIVNINKELYSFLTHENSQTCLLGEEHIINLEKEAVSKFLEENYTNDFEFLSKLYPFIKSEDENDLLNYAKYDLLFEIINKFTFKAGKKQFLLKFFKEKFGKIKVDPIKYNQFKNKIEEYKSKYDYSNYILKTYVINLKKDKSRFEKFSKRFSEFNYEIFEGVNGEQEDELFNSWKEKFNYNLDFDWKYYIIAGQFEMRTQKEALEHYNKYGKGELRIINDTCELVNRGQWGCLQSHIKLLKKIKEENQDKEDYRVLILEDDAVPDENFKERLTKILENKDFENIPLIYLGASQVNWENIEILKSGDIEYYKGSQNHGAFGYIINKSGVNQILELVENEQKPFDIYLSEFQENNESIIIYPNIIKVDLTEKSNIQPVEYDSEKLIKQFRW